MYVVYVCVCVCVCVCVSLCAYTHTPAHTQFTQHPSMHAFKVASVIWHYGNTDPAFGAMQVHMNPQTPIPNPQFPIPNPKSPKPNPESLACSLK